METPLDEDAPLVLRGSRKGTVAALGAGLLFALCAALLGSAGNVLAAIVVGLFALVGLGAGVAGLSPRLASLRLDDQGYTVTSPVKSWRIRWSEIDRLELAELRTGPRGAPAPVVKVVFRDGFERAHLPQTLLAKLRPDEHYVYPAYGNLDVDRLLTLLGRWHARYADEPGDPAHFGWSRAPASSRTTSAFKARGTSVTAAGHGPAGSRPGRVTAPAAGKGRDPAVRQKTFSFGPAYMASA